MPKAKTVRPVKIPPKAPRTSYGTLNEDAVIRWREARFWAINYRPYFATIIRSLIPVPQPGSGTMGVDRWHRCYIDPEAMDRWIVEGGIELIGGVIIHEIGHLLRNHHGRCESMGLDPKLYNYAGDMAINDDLVAERIILPNGVLLPKTFREGMEGMPPDPAFVDGLVEEEYYDLLRRRQEQGKANDPNGPGAGPAAGKCGSCAGGDGEDEQGPPGETGADGTKNVHGVNEVQGELIRRQVARDVIEAAKNRGDVPAWARRWANELLTPEVSWLEEFPAVIRNTIGTVLGHQDYSYVQPSNRAPLPFVVMPVMTNPSLRVVITIDTSGSMSEDDLTRAVSELAGILEACGVDRDVTVITGDAAVGSVQKAFSPEQVELVGGGGTSMHVLMEHAATYRPHFGICLTDCITPWPDEEPEIPWIIGAIGENCPPTPEWAQRVDIRVR